MPGWLALLATVFVVVFLVELPDKTALTTVVLSTRYPPRPVFAGVALAFVIQSLVAVFAGSLIGLLPHGIVRIGAGLLFIAMAAAVVWRTWREKGADEEVKIPEGRRQRPFLTAFGMIMLAEWGDLSQLATAAFQARYNQAVLVFVAATLACWAVTALAVTIGNRLGSLLPKRPVQFAAAGLMALIGLILISGRLI